MKFIWPLSLLLLVQTAWGLGSEIKVIDSQGVSRAMKRNVEQATVAISLAAPKGANVTLENVDGLAPNVEARVDAQGSAQIPVGSGTWRINSSGHKVLEVKIIAAD